MAVRQTLRQLRLPGRMERMPTSENEPLIILDGAHNPHKMAALVASVRQLFPEDAYEVTAVVGALVSKDVRAMLAALLPICTRLVATEPHVPGKPALPAEELATAVGELAPSLPVVVEKDTAVVLRHAHANPPKKTLILITGSIYLIGAIREHWYPSKILLNTAQAAGHQLRMSNE
jgi:dihydrofolate synthase/folylpolyglutamate synthase